ncbi:aquaporin [Streptomyces sp. RB6PN25]|uniref:Aquaporin n=1 Tax=Streptomyces humicola TaxID=2953240 RepID=A0ABT1Q462_9ACTN|nr:aquaporin [Streptomyces humicola]MCQ4084721.1 aquaporin [Streptomyces humicola]
MDRRALVCEFLGALLLVFFGVGSMVLAGPSIGVLGVALSFGFVLLALCYAFGPISGCHVNPAVTLGMLCAGRIGLRGAAGYWVAQFVGGIAGAGLLFTVAKQIPGLSVGAFGSNGYGSRSAVGINIFGAFLSETVLTFLLVTVVLGVTHRLAAPGFVGVPIGIALGVIHLVGIPLTGTSVNPARSLGPALFSGAAALSQLWLFIVAPLAGGAIAALVHRATHPAETADGRQPEHAEEAATRTEPR